MLDAMLPLRLHGSEAELRKNIFVLCQTKIFFFLFFQI